MITVSAYDVIEGMEFKTWFGTHSVLRIDPYNGQSNEVLNELVFDNGYRLKNYKSNVYKLSKKWIPPISPSIRATG